MLPTSDRFPQMANNKCLHPIQLCLRTFEAEVLKMVSLSPKIGRSYKEQECTLFLLFIIGVPA